MESTTLYLIPGDNVMERIMKRAYWDLIYDKIKEEKYDLLVKNIAELKTLLVNLIPNRPDLHKELDEYIDVDFIAQKFEHRLFNNEEFVALFSYIMDWVIKMGTPADEKEAKLFKEVVIETTGEKGFFYVLPYAFDAIHGKLEEITRAVEWLKNSRC